GSSWTSAPASKRSNWCSTWSSRWAGSRCTNATRSCANGSGRWPAGSPSICSPHPPDEVGAAGPFGGAQTDDQGVELVADVDRAGQPANLVGQRLNPVVQLD